LYRRTGQCLGRFSTGETRQSARHQRDRTSGSGPSRLRFVASVDAGLTLQGAPSFSWNSERTDQSQSLMTTIPGSGQMARPATNRARERLHALQQKPVGPDRRTSAKNSPPISSAWRALRVDDDSYILRSLPQRYTGQSFSRAASNLPILGGRGSGIQYHGSASLRESAVFDYDGRWGVAKDAERSFVYQN